ncbi:PREDICTED: interferon lambda receptor 1 [Ficedula albicollis]|uniref:interferon lambda receptor 1 n=1 Tax=Ficedula albicollis TaxID=59894 RepID=UPI000359C8A3|nr:PREDICTED: interferon lambda receptor 1 [Ficedula albicollis]
MRMEQGETFVTSGKFCFARVGALLALCLLQQARGHVRLLPPQNVTLLSKDFAMILAWAPGEGSPPGVTYTVRYESQDRLDKWKKVPHCKNIPRSFCNLTCALPNLYIKVRARVKALWGQSQSPWVKSQFKDYYSDVELAPPVLSLSLRDDSILVRASFPLPTCVESLTWKYDLNLWEAGSEDKKKYEGYFRKDTVTINTTALRGNYCFSARALFESINLKHSEFSQPVCVLLNHKVDWKFSLLVVILLFVLSVFVASPFICCLVKHEAKQRKMPQVLDFSQFKAAGPTFHLELNEKEFCSDDLNCTEKPVPQRRTNRALGGLQRPWMASSPSSSSSSSSEEEEEEEEEEDSSTLIPYHKMPKRHLSCQPAPAALGETSLGSGSGSGSGKAPHFCRDSQKSLMDLQLPSQHREDPSRQLLIPLWTLQVAEDEGIASDCGSDSCTERTPPGSAVLSDALEASNTEEKYYPKSQFPGYQHSHYLGRI